MAKLVFDKAGERLYETGIKNVVLYVNDGSAYGKGVAWNGVSSISENPTGAEANPIYADDIKYLNLISAEEFEATIEAYMCPREFYACDGTASLGKGVMVGQQTRKTFALAYKTTIGNDTESNDHGYKIHIIYGCTASPSDKSYETINDDPEAISFSWDIKTVPVEVGDNFKPTATITIDSTEVDEDILAEIEASLYGTDSHEGTPGTDPTLLMPAEILDLLS